MNLQIKKWVMRSTQKRNVLMLKIWLGTHALFADLTLKVNIFCLVKIRFWLSTETFDIQRALNIQSFTLISFCYPLPLTNLNLLPFYELYTPSLIYNWFLVEFNVECTPFMSYLNLTSDFQVKFTNYLAIKLTSKASDKNLIFLRQFSVFKSL